MPQQMVTQVLSAKTTETTMWNTYPPYVFCFVLASVLSEKGDDTPASEYRTDSSVHNCASSFDCNVTSIGQAADDDDVEWGEDTSEAAVKQRMKDLSDAAKNLAVSDDIEKTPQERIDMFYSYVKVKDVFF